MSQINQGQQMIGWKYQTPLQATYLNSFLAGMSTPGLLTRPKFSGSPLQLGYALTIQPFSLLIVPSDDDVTSAKDENDELVYFKMVKITTTSSMIVNVAPFTVALGFKYSLVNPKEQTPSQQWYGEVVPLSHEDLSKFNGVIIATCQNYTSESTTYYSVTSNGADISDALLIREGWNPSKWLSVVHPTRSGGIHYNKLEVRCHNKPYSSYVNGFGGLTKMENLMYELDTLVDETTNPDGIRGFMPGNYNAFKLQSDEFGLCVSGDELPLDKTPGATFALVDASLTNQGNFETSFTNKMKIYPVQTANTNSFFEDDVLYII